MADLNVGRPRILFPWLCRIVILVLCVFIVIILYRCWWVNRAKAHIIVEDANLVAWMNINNTFTLTPGQDPSDDWLNNTFRYGALIQLGDYDEIPNLLESVIFLDGGSVVHTLSSTELESGFYWINVVGNTSNPNQTPPMAYQHAYLLWPDTGMAHPGCGEIDALTNKEVVCPYGATGSPHVCEHDTDDPVPPEDYEVLHRRCIRARSLHGEFVPEDIITYWQGEHRYRMVEESWVEMVDDNGTQVPEPHEQYHFALRDNIAVSIWKDGVQQTIAGLDGVDTIRVKIKPHEGSAGKTPRQQHGGFHSPPWGVE